MEKNFRFIAMLAACFVFYLFLASCTSNHNFAGKQGQVLKGPIHITGYDISDGSLTLEDNNNNNASWVVVSRITTIKWNVTGSAASKILITSIDHDPNFPSNPDFFSTPPHDSSDHWEAKIGAPSPGSGIIEKYYIEWKLISTGKTYIFDPLLQLNP